VLDTPPAADVTVTLTSSDTSEGTIAPSSLTFTPANWKTPQFVTVTGVDDSVIDGDQSYIIDITTSSSDAGYDGLVTPGVAVSNIDNDQPLLLFSDGFDVSEWNGIWVEDAQNDWFRSSQRATSSSHSAEVDGSATNATLTLATGIDLADMQSATLSFNWLIESSFDSGEYLSLDVSTNGGSNWIQDVRRLSGNVSPENVWQSENVDLTPYLSSNLKVRFRASASTSDEDANVDSVQITGIPLGPNTSPIAVAAGPYVVAEGSSIALSGAGSSDPDGTITGYAWDLDNDGQYDDATGVSPSFSTTASGTFSIGLLVTDNRGGTATAFANVTVNNVAPTANAGADQNGQPGTPVNLTAAASFDPGNDIVSYQWDLDNDGQFDDAVGVQTVLNSAETGTFVVRVLVTDADGASSTDEALVTINTPPAEVVLFADSFEIAEWNGLWVEDSQNDWFRSTQRATDGTRSAEVDGSATNAALSLANSVNVSSFASTVLTFDWLIESGFDSGEFLALDISTNGGSTWTQNVRSLLGNVDSEDVWHSETVDLSPFLSSNLRVRFRSSVSGSAEDANVDNVRIVGVNAAPSNARIGDLEGLSDVPAAESPVDPDELKFNKPALRTLSSWEMVSGAVLNSLSDRRAEAVDVILADDSELDSWDVLDVWLHLASPARQ
jgi:hypothetical protein